jgi:hypothetical protein
LTESNFIPQLLSNGALQLSLRSGFDTPHSIIRGLPSKAPTSLQPSPPCIKASHFVIVARTLPLHTCFSCKLCPHELNHSTQVLLWSFGCVHEAGSRDNTCRANSFRLMTAFTVKTPMNPKRHTVIDDRGNKKGQMVRR